MKYHIVLIFLSVIAWTQADIKKHETLRAMVAKFLQSSFEHKTNCIEENMASKDAVDKFWKHQYNGEDDQNLKCYLKCSFIKINILDENGVFLVDNLMHQNGIVHQIITHYPDLGRKAIEKCKSIEFTDVCEKAYQLLQCGFKAIMELSDN